MIISNIDENDTNEETVGYYLILLNSIIVGVSFAVVIWTIISCLLLAIHINYEIPEYTSIYAKITFPVLGIFLIIFLIASVRRVRKDLGVYYNAKQITISCVIGLFFLFYILFKLMNII